MNKVCCPELPGYGRKLGYAFIGMDQVIFISLRPFDF
jgi:hypothetical protein